MRIHAIQTGRVQIKEAQIEGRGHGLWRQLQPMLSREWAEWVPVYAWAIEHPEGVIVVDTGSGAHLKSLPRWHPYFQFAVRFDIEPEQEVGPQLRSLGIGARDVKTVVLTHLHIDHDGGLAHFPHSRIFADGGEIARTAGVAGAPARLSAEPMAEMVRPAAARLAAVALRALCPQRADHAAPETSSRSRRRATRRTMSPSSCATASSRSCSPATRPIWKRPCCSGTIDGVSPDETAARRHSPTSAPCAPHARRSTCRRTIRDPPKGSPGDAR